MLGGYILCYVTTKIKKKYKQKTKGHEKTYGGDEYVYCFDYGPDFMGVCKHPNSSNSIYELCIIFCISIIPQ